MIRRKKILKLAYDYVSINHNWSNLTDQLNNLYNQFVKITLKMLQYLRCLI